MVPASVHHIQYPSSSNNVLYGVRKWDECIIQGFLALIDTRQNLVTDEHFKCTFVVVSTCIVPKDIFSQLVSNSTAT